MDTDLPPRLRQQARQEPDASNLALYNLGNRKLDKARLDSSQAGNAENTDETYEAFGLVGD